ncbi:MAG: CBS domain-containing protein [Anaerolineaceae bacterium]|nr:CBS domain-containing protein [Anaerolineaceae bacterium]MBN2676641.1 CBS domain-containing protein [Anaerolineaceae bacterium]
MATVKQLLQKKGFQVYSVAISNTVKQALNLMAEKSCGAVLVMDGTTLAGIFSERDFARKVLNENCVLDLPVERYMTKEIYAVSPETTIDECMALMTQKKFRHLPVMEGDNLTGIISIGDIVLFVIADKDILIRSLENYIVGHDYNQ